MMQEYVVWGWKKTMKIISGEANLKFGWLLWDWLCIPYNMLKHFHLKGSLCLNVLWFLSARLGPLICLNFCLRLMTGSFDKTVKIWSIDGKFTHKLDNFLATISGICYVPRNKTVWVAGGTSYASLFDPKSGDNVSW